MVKKGTRNLGNYEVGRTIGEGTFAKVKFARNTDTGESVAMKVLAKATILKHIMVDQVFIKKPVKAFGFRFCNLYSMLLLNC